MPTLRLIGPACRDRYIRCGVELGPTDGSINEGILEDGAGELAVRRRPADAGREWLPLLTLRPALHNNRCERRPLGTSLDDIDARNRADIAAQLGRPVAPGPATPEEVVAMTRAGIDSRFTISYINRSTSMSPVTAQDVIYMHDQGVNEQVIQAMLTPGAACSRAEVARAMPPRILILEDPWWPYRYPRYGFVYGGGCRCY